MAGRETTGVEAATPDLFVDRPWVVVPGAHAGPGDVATVEALAVATGARPIRLTADEHDEAVAAISHLPLVLSDVAGRGGGRRHRPGAMWPLAGSSRRAGGAT